MTYLSKLDWLGQLLTIIIYCLTKLGEIILDSAHIMTAVLNIIITNQGCVWNRGKAGKKVLNFLLYIYIYIYIIVRTELGLDST